jgi:hypothetical protein
MDRARARKARARQRKRSKKLARTKSTATAARRPTRSAASRAFNRKPTASASVSEWSRRPATRTPSACGQTTKSVPPGTEHSPEGDQAISANDEPNRTPVDAAALRKRIDPIADRTDEAREREPTGPRGGKEGIGSWARCERRKHAGSRSARTRSDSPRLTLERLSLDPPCPWHEWQFAARMPRTFASKSDASSTVPNPAPQQTPSQVSCRMVASIAFALQEVTGAV